jgi:tetratricopeptide (TPR) repeat protein
VVEGVNHPQVQVWLAKSGAPPSFSANTQQPTLYLQAADRCHPPRKCFDICNSIADRSVPLVRKPDSPRIPTAPKALGSAGEAGGYHAFAHIGARDVEYDKALAVAEDLARQYPESERAFLAQTFNLRALGRFEAADRLAAERMKRIPGDVAAMRVLVWNATAGGDYVKAHALDQNIIDDGKAEARDLNSIAWQSLFTGRIEPSDIEDSLKAAQLSQNDASMLHTLGCVYAEVGKTKAAREVLIQAMDVLNLDEPDDNYWYAFGRIAEQSGERDAALANYARVTKPKKAVEIPDSTYYLAQVRLQALRGEKQ